MLDARSLETRVFLFTDLESSTRLWQAFPDTMKTASERHDAILHSAIEQWNGHVVKNLGDGLMAVFSSVADCVTACLDAQRRLQEEPWGAVGPLRVRMGIHVGEAQPRAGDFYGPPVNRAARIMAAAHGGQILLSALAAGLVEGGLPPGSELRDLGEHRLKDLFQPEHIYQVAHPELMSDFPPLASLSYRPNNLPIQASEFFGREVQLNEIRQLLDASGVRLLTLIGPGGIGKTRLALQAAADQIDRFEDGVYFVDLSPIRDPDAVFEAIVRTVGLAGASDEESIQVLKRQLRDRHILLVLDNFEQVIEAAEGVVDMLQHCRNLKVLVTSREALRVRGEHLVPVPPMTLPNGKGPSAVEIVSEYEAVRLFVERAREAQPDFVLDEHNAAAIAEICTRLDGLPLAIELAASRLRLFSPDDLRDRLRTRLDVLGSGPRDLPARQRTLRSTIEWSYELLDADERSILQILSVFAPTRVDVIEGVVERLEPLRGIDVVDRLMSLVDKSLVRSVEVGGRQQLSMLETIRQYAMERLAEEPTLEMDARREHAGYFADYAQRMRARLQGPEREATLEELATELGNLKTAWQFWITTRDLEQLNRMLDSLWVLHDTRGWYHAAVELTNDLLSVLDALPESSERAQEEITLRLSLARGIMTIRGYTEEVEQTYVRALALSESMGELPQRFPVLRSLASFYLFRGEFDKAETVGRKLLDLAEQQADLGAQVEGQHVLGSSLAFGGDVPTGLDHLSRAITLFDPQQSSRRLHFGPSPGVTAHTTSAFLLWFTGYPERAAERAINGLDLARDMNHPYTLAYTYFHVGFLDVLLRDLERVYERSTAALQVARDNDYPVWKALGLILQGMSMTGLGSPEQGVAQAEQGAALYQGLRTPPLFWPLVLYVRSAACSLAGATTEALELIDQAISITGDSSLYPEFALLKGDLLYATSGIDDAEPWYLSMYDAAGRQGSRMCQLRACIRLVRHRRDSGRAPDGSETLRDVYLTFTEGFETKDLIEAGALLTEGDPG